MGGRWFGNMNDLIVPEDDHMIITHYFPFPDNENGRVKNSFGQKIQTLLIQMFKLRKTFVISCKFSGQKNHVTDASCVEL
jgi:hypothetical protein